MKKVLWLIMVSSFTLGLVADGNAVFRHGSHPNPTKDRTTGGGCSFQASESPSGGWLYMCNGGDSGCPTCEHHVDAVCEYVDQKGVGHNCYTSLINPGGKGQVGGNVPTTSAGTTSKNVSQTAKPGGSVAALAQVYQTGNGCRFIGITYKGDNVWGYTCDGGKTFGAWCDHTRDGRGHDCVAINPPYTPPSVTKGTTTGKTGGQSSNKDTLPNGVPVKAGGGGGKF